jgi:superfamily II DNA or RNA helicase
MDRPSVQNATEISIAKSNMHIEYDKLRDWQQSATNDCLQKFSGDQNSYLLEACPAAGKTLFCGYIAKYLLGKVDIRNHPEATQDFTRKDIDFVLVVVPTTAIKGDAHSGFVGSWFEKLGLNLTPTLKTSGGPPPKSFDGAVITYQQLAQGTLTPIIKLWAERLGIRILLICDEIHHASEDNVWGTTLSQIVDSAKYQISVSGTPFRTDERPIAGITYDVEGRAIPDFRYNYSQALQDGVCRPVYISHDDGIMNYSYNDEFESVKISETLEADVAKVSAVAFHKNSEFLREVILKAQHQLDIYEKEERNYVPAGLIICRVGRKGQEDKPVEQIAKKVKQITGEDCVVVTHADPNANQKIDEFRNSDKRWICAVRKISEGVDIPRLRVMVMANATKSELLFRQMAGRIVRTIETGEHSTLYMAKFRELAEFAQRLEQEVALGLRGEEPPPRGPRGEEGEGDGEDEEERNEFQILDGTFEEGGGLFRGELFLPREITHAKKVIASHQDLNVFTPDQIALVIRMSGQVIKEEKDLKPELPLHMRKKTIRAKIVKRANQISVLQAPAGDRKKANFKPIWREVRGRFGVNSIDDLFDNHSLEKMEAVLQWLYEYKIQEQKRSAGVFSVD